jgi:raffinose/stachyose/melibiose transport system substrate-binding protein
MLKKFCKLTVLSGILLPLVFTSCWGKKSKGEVRYLNFKPESAGVYEELAQIYEKETGVKVIIETAANNAYESTLTAKMANRNPPTLFQINGPKGYANWKEYCADLKDTELYKHLTDKSLAITDKDGVYGIPYVLEGYGIIYNKDITDKYFALKKRGTSFKNMDEINDFEKLKKLVEDMQKNASKLGIKGVFASTSLKAGEDWRWQTHLLNIPIYYEFTNNNIDLTSDQTDTITFEYNKNFKNIFDLYLNNSVIPPKQVGIKTVDNSMSEFALGECAMVQNGNWAWSQIEGVKGNVVESDKIKYLPIYTGMKVDPQQGLCIGTENFYAVNKKASTEDQKATVDFVYWLYSSEKGKDYVINKLGFISPFDTFTESEKPKDPLAVEVLHWMKKSDITTIPWYFTLFPSQVFKEDFGSDLLRYAQGSENWATVTDNVIADWKKESAASQ